MKAYIRQSRKVIDPFDNFVCDCLIGNKTLATLQRETFLMLGIEPLFIATDQQVSDSSDYILTDDNVCFTKELLVEFLARSLQQKKNAICALKQGITTRRTMSCIQNVSSAEDFVKYNLRYVPEKKSRSGDCVPIVVDPDQFCGYIPVPEHICDNEKYLIPITEKFVIQIEHWANLWVANIVTVLAEVARLRKNSKVKLFLAALKARSLNKWNVLSKANKIGRNCDIHPTAYIEAVLLVQR